MKTLLLMLTSIFFVLTGTFLELSAQSPGVGINNSGAVPDPSSILDIESTNKGFLPPRMTTAQRDAIASPVEGLTIYNTDDNCIQFFNGTIWVDPCAGSSIPSFICGTSTVEFIYNGNPVTYGTVEGQNGSCWLDRNLGASQVATSSTDSDAYGDLFQWGREADGHQLRTSSIISTLSNSSQPGHDDFIVSAVTPFDWRNPQNTDLWQGVNGVNNPCPTGFRLPTEQDFNDEIASWSSNNAAGAFASSLKLPLAGFRNGADGSINDEEISCRYWTSTVSGIQSRNLYFISNDAFMNTNTRAFGGSVRCIKD